MKNLFAVSIAFFFFFFTACGGVEPVSPTDTTGTTSPSVAVETLPTTTDTTPDDLMYNWKVLYIKRAFGPEKPKAEPEGGRGWNDVLCDEYMGVMDGERALEGADEGVWKAAGVAKEDAIQKHREAVLIFATDIGKLLVLPLPERQKLEEEWDHTCDGLLNPSDTGELVSALTRSLRESGVEKPPISEGLRKVLFVTFRKQTMGEGVEVGSALYWFTPQELGFAPDKMVPPE